MTKDFLFFVAILATVCFLPAASLAQHIEVSLIGPDYQATTNVVQNKTFFLNATVVCRSLAGCGDVNGTALYNGSSADPDTPINKTEGDKPFFVNETPASAAKLCENNPLSDGDMCILNWTINATGDPDTNWKASVIFNTSLWPAVEANQTENASISILPCVLDYDLTWSSISFGQLNPTTENNSAPGNSENLYNITVNPGSCSTDFYIRGTDLVNETFARNISVGNISWSNESLNIEDGFYVMKLTDEPIAINILAGFNVTSWYWLNVPAVVAGIYNGTISITGVDNGESP